MVAATIKWKSNAKHVALFLTGKIIRVTFDTVWTARVSSWRGATEKWSKPGWPAKKGGSAWGKWSTDHLLMCMRPWCEGAHYVIYESLCRQTTLLLFIRLAEWSSQVCPTHVTEEPHCMRSMSGANEEEYNHSPLCHLQPRPATLTRSGHWRYTEKQKTAKACSCM